MIMAVVLFIVAIVCSYNGVWWAAVLCMVCAIGCAADATERDRHQARRISQLRRRQLDDWHERHKADPY